MFAIRIGYKRGRWINKKYEPPPPKKKNQQITKKENLKQHEENGETIKLYEQNIFFEAKL